MASPRPTSYVPRNPAISPLRDSDPDSRGRRPRHRVPAPADEGLVIREIWLLRSRALLARAHGADTAYRDCRDRYRAMAKQFGFEGHLAWAEAMP